jgi:hypothetical protein
MYLSKMTVVAALMIMCVVATPKEVDACSGGGSFSSYNYPIDYLLDETTDIIAMGYIRQVSESRYSVPFQNHSDT